MINIRILVFNPILKGRCLHSARRHIKVVDEDGQNVRCRIICIDGG